MSQTIVSLCLITLAGAVQFDTRNDLSTIELAVQRAQAATGQFPKDTSSLNIVHMSSASDLVSQVTSTFPTASCIRRESLLKKVPGAMKARALFEPKAFGTAPSDCRQPNTKHSQAPPALCVFSHAVTNGHGNVCDTKSCLVSKPLETDAKFLSEGFVSCDDLGCTKKEQNDAPIYDGVYVVSQPGHGKVDTFMSEGLLRVFVGLDYLLGAGKTMPLLVRDKSKIVVETLGALGITEDRIITGNVRARATVVPELAHAGKVSAPLVQLARWGLRTQVPMVLARESTGRLPLVTVVKGSSDDASHMVNYDAVVKALREQLKGYHVMEVEDPQTMPMGDAMRLFSSSAVVVAPHGGGLYNLLAASPGGATVEIASGIACSPNNYAEMGSLLGLNHHVLYTKDAAYDGGMKVNVEQLVPVVQAALQSRESTTA